MTPTRRHFLSVLAAGLAAGLVVVPASSARPTPPELVAPGPWPGMASDSATGISIRFIRAYDVQADRWPTRLGDVALVQPELIMRT